jgi:coenzyme F420-reducing hydrogenase delta subunit
MCSGRYDPVIVLEALIDGADGVLLAGCHIGDCHYIVGNYYAERKLEMLKKLLALTGLENERLRLEWVSASEGARFAEIVKEFTNEIKTLGPSPVSGETPDPNLLDNLRAAQMAAAGFRLRVLVGREKSLIDEGNIYGERLSQEDFDKVMNDAIATEYLRSKIYLMLRKEPLSVKELSKRLNVDSQKTLQEIVVMRRHGMVALGRVDDTTPLYVALEAGR